MPTTIEALWEGQSWLLDGFDKLSTAIGHAVAGTFSTTKDTDAIRAADGSCPGPEESAFYHRHWPPPRAHPNFGPKRLSTLSWSGTYHQQKSVRTLGGTPVGFAFKFAPHSDSTSVIARSCHSGATHTNRPETPRFCASTPVLRFLWLQKWPRCGCVRPLASSGLQAYPAEVFFLVFHRLRALCTTRYRLRPPLFCKAIRWNDVLR